MDDPVDIGQRLKAVRQARGLSQRKLAQITGVANATISQIEANAFNPTIGVLKRVLGGIPISLAEFFSDEASLRDDQVFFRARELFELSEGGVSYRQVGRDLRGKAIQLLHEKYAPGATTGRHSLRHEGQECGLVLSGELTVTVGEKTAILGPGDAYYFDSDQPHSFKNEGAVMCELVTACTPPSF